MSDSRRSAEIALLREELREELRLLRTRVERLTVVVENLGASEWETVSEVPETSSGYQVPESRTGASAATSGEQTWEERERICQEVGQFVRRALSGSHRGVSGRNRIRLASRVWLVFRTIRGVVHRDPCKVFHRFSEVKELCFDQNEPGDSVFVGLPSLREANWVLEDPASGIHPHLVVQGDQINPLFDIGRLTVESGATVDVICIAETDLGLLVAVPGDVWNRRISARVLPERCLSRAVLCSVAACDMQFRTTVAQGEEVQVWVGLLAASQKAQLEFDIDRSETAHRFNLFEDLVPYADGLFSISQERFNFFSAAESSGGGNASSSRVPAPRTKDAGRLKDLEDGMAEIRSSLNLLLQQQQKIEGQPAQTRPSALRREGEPRGSDGRVRVTLPTESGPRGSGGSLKLAGLDPSVVSAALTAGVPEDHLREMSELLRRNPHRMEDVPASSRRRNLDELSESDDEEAEVEAALGSGTPGGSSPSDGGVAKAIVKLTKVCTSLAEQRSYRKNNRLDALLDGSGGSGEGSGLGSARRNAAALRYLKDCLFKDPEMIYRSIESNMATDFASRPSAPGSPLAGATSRGWLEARSRLQQYTAHIRWTWAVCGIWDCLMRGETSQARARAALLVAAADQASVDSGSWLLSNVMLLESPAPFHSFANHQPPGPQDLQHTALVDTRWMDVFLNHVKELDSYQEAKRRLTKGPKKEDGSEKEKPAAKPKAKPKATGKGKGGGKTSEAPSPEPEGSH
eukprot:Skav211328  [mRNA]  locus=scaffold3120:24503:26814:+ [translate_table: standard]